MARAPKDPKGSAFTQFVNALKNLEVGQSFTVPAMYAREKMLVRAAGALLDREYMVRQDVAGHRIGRKA